MAEYHVLRADEVPLPYSTYDRIRDEIISKLTLEDDTRTEAQTQALITLTTSVTATSLQDIIAVLRDGGFTYTDVNDVFRDLSKDNKDIVDPEFISIVENATGPDDFSSLALYSAYWTNNNLGGTLVPMTVTRIFSKPMLSVRRAHWMPFTIWMLLIRKPAKSRILSSWSAY